MSTQQSNKEPYHPAYLINFEEYLKPKKPGKRLQCFEKPLKPKRPFSDFCITVKRLKVLRWARNKCLRISKTFHQLPLPSFLGFLRARNDDGLCKPKTGFEIYCEMSSIHGFHIFVGAKTWQRVLWWLLICTALLLSLVVLIILKNITADTPTVHQIDSLAQPMYAQANPFPTITICSLNRASKRRLSNMAKELDVAEHILQQIPWITDRRLSSMNQGLINGLMQTNLTWEQLLEQLSPKVCETQLLGCNWQGRPQNCSELLTTHWSYSEGRCCRFNRQPTCPSTQCSLANKLTLHLKTQLADYSSTMVATNGYEVLIHEAHTVANADTERVFVPGGSEAHLILRSFSTHATSHIPSLSIEKRQCYLPHERVLFHFSNYSQDNCLAECQSQGIFQNCDCVPPFMPRRMNWPICRLNQFPCLLEQNKTWQELQVKCNCLPSCQFYRYELHTDLAALDDEYSMPNVEEDFLKNNTDSDIIVINIYYGSLRAEQRVLDVYQNWLTFIGTFGGITGLFMGCSFVSVFELIFFMCVRPTCNWLTRQQILWRQRRQRRRQVQANNGN